MLTFSQLPLLFLGTVCLVFANAKDPQEGKLAQVLAREDRLENVVGKLIEFFEENNPAAEAKGKKTAVAAKHEKADTAAEERDERISELVDLERRLEAQLHESDSEEKHKNFATEDEASRMQSLINGLARGEGDDEVDDDVKAELMTIKEQSDAKPWWRRRIVRVRVPLPRVRVRIPPVRWGRRRRRFWGKK